jgi:hypothetical protein
MVIAAMVVLSLVVVGRESVGIAHNAERPQ